MPQFQRKDQRNSNNYPKTTFNPKTTWFFHGIFKCIYRWNILSKLCLIVYRIIIFNCKNFETCKKCMDRLIITVENWQFWKVTIKNAKKDIFWDQKNAIFFAMFRIQQQLRYQKFSENICQKMISVFLTGRGSHPFSDESSQNRWVRPKTDEFGEFIPKPMTHPKTDDFCKFIPKQMHFQVSTT